MNKTVYLFGPVILNLVIVGNLMVPEIVCGTFSVTL